MSLSNIKGTPGALLFLYIAVLIGVIGFHFAFRGSVQV